MRGGAVLIHKIGDLFLDQTDHDVPHVLAAKDSVAVLVYDLALLGKHVVVLDQVLAKVEVHSLDFGLRLLDGACHQPVFERLVTIHSEFLKDRLHSWAYEATHELVLKGEIEPGIAGISLPSGAATELVVDAACLVALGAD